MPSQYALHVFSNPTAVSDNVWEKWYLNEHLPDMVNSKTTTRASWYRQVPGKSTTKDADQKYVALYQTDEKFCLDTDNFRKDVRIKSESFPDPEATCDDYAKF